MILFTVLGYVTDIKGALPYMCPPDAIKERAVESWYLVAVSYTHLTLPTILRV